MHITYHKTKTKKKKAKGKKALFTTSTKEEILTRDKVCIISGDPIDDYHHSFYGPNYVNYGEDRNCHYEGVGLSNKIHYIIHHGTDVKLATEYRIICMEYSKQMRLIYK